jgi:hypothetical protein
VSTPESFQTGMGRRFYEATMPKIAEQLERLNANLEDLLAELRKQGTTPATPTPQQQPDNDPRKIAFARKR